MDSIIIGGYSYLCSTIFKAEQEIFKMGKKENGTASDDQLVKMHLNARKRKKRRLVITMVVIIVVVLVAVVVGVNYAQSRISATIGSSDESSVESAEVTTGSISTTVSGSGTLTSQDVESLTLLSSVDIEDFYVEEGDTVTAGDLIATVDTASLLSAMSDIQDQLDALDEQIEETSGETVSDTVAAGVSGRVKLINVTSGDEVVTVMYEYGSLMLLSLDGYMAVDISTELVSAGETVTVTLSDGSTVTGTVESSTGGTAVILVTDNGTTYGDTVSVATEDGTELGSGTLYIHSQIMVTGYAGTVSTVSVSENEYVDAGDTLMTLTDTETSVNYDALLKQREEIEELMADLITVYQEGGILATISGTVESLTSTGSSSLMSSDQSSSSSTSYTTVATISPETQMTITISVDETDILSLEVGQEAAVTIDSIGDETYSGSVTEISTTATSSSGVTAYSAVITIDKTEDMLSGMSASVVITIEGVEDALLIPIEALHQTSSTSYVYTEYDEETGEFSGMVEVTTGLSNSSYVEITSGLEEGDVVYYTASEDESSIFDSIGGSFSMDSVGGDSGVSDFSGGGSSDIGGSIGGSAGGSIGGDMGSMP